MSESELVELIRRPFEAVERVDRDTRKASGKCARCGFDRGGVVLRGQSKRDAGICTCEEGGEATDGS